MAYGGAGEQGPGAGGSAAKKFFTSLPGVFTGVATIVTAVAAIAGAFGSHDDSAPPASAPPPATTAPAGTAATAPATAAGATPDTTAAGQSGYRPVWGPKDLLVTNDGTDLSDVPPVSSTGDHADLYDNEVGFGPMNSAKLAVWHGSADPTADQCADLVTSGSSAMGVRTTTGTVVCAQTDQGVVAALRVESKDRDTLTTRTVTTIWAPR